MMTDACGSAAGEKTFQQWWRFTYGNTAQWELRASTDLLPNLLAPLCGVALFM